MNKIIQLGAESLPDTIYFYSKNYIVWTKYSAVEDKYTTEYKKIKIPFYLNLPFLRGLRMFYAKKQLVGNKPIYFLLSILILQLLLSFKYPMLSFILPFLIRFISIGLFNFVLMIDPNHPIGNQMRLHSAEHLVSERRLFNRDTKYSFGCDNSHMIIWLMINLITVHFMPITLAYLLSMFISGEIVYWLVFHQDSILAKILKPFVFNFQDFTLQEPEEQHVKTATLAMTKLEELENAI